VNQLLLPMPAKGILRERLVDAVMSHHEQTGDICILDYFPGNVAKHAQCVLYDGRFCWVTTGKIAISDPNSRLTWIKIKHLNPKLIVNVTSSADVLVSLIDFLTG